jgi:hypothetical protein
MGVGYQGPEVSALIKALSFENPPGLGYGDNPTVFDGYITSFVIKFQKKYGILQTGFVGPLTRAKLNKLYGCSITSPSESIVINSVTGPNSLNVGQTETWVFNITAPAGTKLTHSIDWGDGIIKTDNNTTGVANNINSTFTVTHSYSQAGTYTIKFKVDNGVFCITTPCEARKSAETTLTVVVGTSTQPSITINSIAGPTSLNIGQIGTWTVNTTAPTTSKLKYLIEWGGEGSDGIFGPYFATSNNILISHAYSKAWTYNLTAKVWDDNTCDPIFDVPTQIVQDSQRCVVSKQITVVVGTSTQPTITVTSPNGGEQLVIGQTYKISWQSTSYDTGYYAAVYLVNNKTKEKTIIRNGASVNDVFIWTVPQTTTDPNFSRLGGNVYKIEVDIIKMGEIVAVVNSDVSDSEFVIAGIEIISPNAGEVLNVGQQYNTTWTGKGEKGVTSYNVYLTGLLTGSRYIGTAYPKADGTGTFTWTVPSDVYPGSSSQLQFSATGTSIVSSKSFTITSTSTKPTITVISPNGGETWKEGESRVINLSYNNMASGNVNIFLGNQNLVKCQIAYTPLNGAINITVPKIGGSNCPNIPAPTSGTGLYKLYVIATGNGGTIVGDESDNYFTISVPTVVVQPSITVTSPNGGENWQAGTTHNITWSSAGLLSTDSINIRLVNYASSSPVYTVVANSLAGNLNSYNWTVPSNITAGQYYKISLGVIRYTVSSTTNQASDLSNNYFTISAPTTTVNGVCGSANGTTVASAPTTNLCTVGTASTVNGSGPWQWNCYGSNGGTSSSCSALKTSSPAQPIIASCSASPNPAQIGQTVTWTVSKTGGNGNYSYSWNGNTPTAMSSNATSYTTSGTKTATVTITDTANHSATASCSVNVTAVPPTITSLSPATGQVTSMITVNGTGFSSANGIHLTASDVNQEIPATFVSSTQLKFSLANQFPPGNYTLNVAVSTSSGAESNSKLLTVTAPVTAVNGVCGTSNGTTVTSAPTTNLCATGTASALSGSGPWSWTCSGSGGGTNAACSASKAQSSVTLNSVQIDGTNLKVNYSKNFTGCAHIINTSYNLLHTQNWFCTTGNNVAITAPLSDFQITAGQQVKMCNGNNYGICSGLVTVTSAPVGTASLSDSQAQAIIDLIQTFGKDSLSQIMSGIQALLSK